MCICIEYLIYSVYLTVSVLLLNLTTVSYCNEYNNNKTKYDLKSPLIYIYIYIYIANDKYYPQIFSKPA